MKQYFLISFLLVKSLSSSGQNLIYNPGFEIYSSCPDGYSSPIEDQVVKATGWKSFRETPDYFHTCAPFAGVNIPNNAMGFQYAHSGNAYVGGATYNKNGLYREIVGSTLVSPLIIGQKYFISFFVSLSGKSGFNYATDNIGAKFSTIAYNYLSNPIPIDNAPQFNYNGFISDTLNWTKITGSFTADSAYSRIALGNFFDDVNTDTICISPGTMTLDGYYFIDNICLTTDSTFAYNWTDIRDFAENEIVSLFPNPSNGVFSVKLESSSQYFLSVFDVGGKVVFQKAGKETEFQFDLSQYPKGMYAVFMTINEHTICEKIIIQ